MCTSVYVNENNIKLFGRNFDYERSFGEKIVIVPSNKRLNFKYKGEISSHYSFIGIAHVDEDNPLFYDGLNECGLAIASLNFVGEAKYFPFDEKKENITHYELISYFLSSCKNVDEVKKILDKAIITNDNYKNYPLSFLHWMICDKKECIILEQTENGLKYYQDDVGVLTNNPPFPFQRFNLNNYMSVSSSLASNNFSSKIKMNVYSRGLAMLGLPGDASSQSRYVRASFTKLNSIYGDNLKEGINQFFHILQNVEQIKGTVTVSEGEYEYTIYSNCYDLESLCLYFKTYDDFKIKKVELKKEDGENLIIKSFSDFD